MFYTCLELYISNKLKSSINYLILQNVPQPSCTNSVNIKPFPESLSLAPSIEIGKWNNSCSKLLGSSNYYFIRQEFNSVRLSWEKESKVGLFTCPCPSITEILPANPSSISLWLKHWASPPALLLSRCRSFSFPGHRARNVEKHFLRPQGH